MTASARRFFFVHMQRTAGTSLLHRLRRCFEPSAIYPSEADGSVVLAVVDVEHLKAQWAARGPEIELVAGHFPLCTTELLGGDFTTFTVLRDPIARTLSYLRHHKQAVSSPWGRALLAKAGHEASAEEAERSIEEIYDDPLRFPALVHNHFVKMLSLSTEEMTAGVVTNVTFTRDRLERAKEALTRIDVVGLQERFDEFCDELRSRFGWDLSGPAYANETEPMPVPDRLVTRIAADNALDVELYEFARSLVSSTGPASPPTV